MKKRKKITKDKMVEDLEPEEIDNEEEEHYPFYQPIYNYFQFFIGGPNNIDKNKQQGKPGGGPPPY